VRDEHVGGPVDHREQGPVPRRRRIRLSHQVQDSPGFLRLSGTSGLPYVIPTRRNARASLNPSIHLLRLRCRACPLHRPFRILLDFRGCRVPSVLFTQVPPADWAQRLASRYRESFPCALAEGRPIAGRARSLCCMIIADSPGFVRLSGPFGISVSRCAPAGCDPRDAAWARTCSATKP
jgi:hypothetical protein